MSDVTTPTVEDVQEAVSPVHRYERAFQLPPTVPDDFKELHAQIVNDMLVEARGLPMTTVQTLLLERIAYFYITMKMAEMSLEGRRVSPSQMKDFIRQWQDMTAEFNKQLAAHHARLREQMINDIFEMLMDALPLIRDEDDRKEYRKSISAKFQEMGL